MTTTEVDVAPPERHSLYNGFAFMWDSGCESNVTIGITEITHDSRSRALTGEVEVAIDDGSGLKALTAYNRFNLLNSRARADFVKHIQNQCLSDEMRFYPWERIIEAVCVSAVRGYRQGEPPSQIGKKPASMKLDYQLCPILEKNQPTTIYGPGSSAKSYLATYIACLVQFGICPDDRRLSNWLPTPGNVLYLDWESDQATHERRVWAIKQGLDVDAEDTFLYRFCSQPLAADLSQIQRLVNDNKIDLVIIDSQMAASGYGADPSQVASLYYNALRSLRCTSLTLDHVSKSDGKDSSSVGPYGSVVKYNRSRSQFEVKKSQNAGDSYLELSLKHVKHNSGKHLPEIGIRIEFTENSEGDLERVVFKGCDVADNPDLFKTLSATTRLVDALKRGKQDTKTLSEELELPETTVRARLNGNKRLFKRFPDGWGLLD